MRHFRPSRAFALAIGPAAWLLSGCQTIHDAQLNLPPTSRPWPSDATSDRGQLGSNTYRACVKAPRPSAARRPPPGSRWDLGIAGERSTEKRVRFRFQFTSQGDAPRSGNASDWFERQRHVARVLVARSPGRQPDLSRPRRRGRRTFIYDTRYPDRLTWFHGENAQTWRVVPQQQWQGAADRSTALPPWAVRLNDEQGRALGCHDWCPKAASSGLWPRRPRST